MYQETEMLASYDKIFTSQRETYTAGMMEERDQAMDVGKVYKDTKQ